MKNNFALIVKQQRQDIACPEATPAQHNSVILKNNKLHNLKCPSDNQNDLKSCSSSRSNRGLKQCLLNTTPEKVMRSDPEQCIITTNHQLTGIPWDFHKNAQWPQWSRGFGNLDSQIKFLLSCCKPPFHAVEITVHIHSESSVSSLSTSHGLDLKKREIQGRNRGNINPVTTGIIHNGWRIFTIFWSAYFYEWIISYPTNLWIWLPLSCLNFPTWCKGFLSYIWQVYLKFHRGVLRLKQNGGYKHFSG